MITIYKYLVGNGKVELPKYSTILKVAFQRSQLCVWALIETDIVETETYTFKIYGTGWEAADLTLRDIFIDTIFEGDFVWHVFYYKED